MLKTKIYNVAFFSICLLVVGISVLVTMNAENSQQKDLVVGVHIKGAVKNPDCVTNEFGEYSGAAGPSLQNSFFARFVHCNYSC